MWSPINTSCASSLLSGRTVATAKGPNALSFLRRAASVALLFCVLLAGGCGYGLGTDGPSVLPPPPGGGLPTIKFKSVDSPTMHSWLPHIIRTELRDEIAARDLARWVDSGPADYELAVKVENFLFRSWITNSDDSTMLYSASIAMQGTVYKGNSTEVVWNSGVVSYSQSYETVQERVAASDMTRELARRFTSAMRQAF